MHTPAIMNQIAAATSSKQQSPQIEGAAPDASFNHVLSREVASRKDSSNAERSQPNAASNASNTSNAAANAAPANSGSANASSQSAAKGPGKSTDKEKTKDKDDKSATDGTAADTAATQNAPADLLALVANIGQMTAADKAAAASSDAKAIAGAKLGIDGVKADAATQIDAKAGIDGKLNATADGKNAKDAAGADFAAEMKRGADLKQPADALNIKSGQDQPALIAAEAAAIEHAVKATEAADTQPAQALATLTAVQQAAQAALHAAPGQMADRLTPHVGTPAWDNALSQRVVWMVAGGEQSASLTLNPPDLGPLQVVLNVSNSTANATFVAAQPEVRQALEAAMPKLRDMLGEAGIQLGQATVSSGSQQNQPGAQPEPTRHAASTGDTHLDSTDTQIRVPRGRTVSSGNGLVDTFV
jgi:flagellar hook-length control protein FliK